MGPYEQVIQIVNWLLPAWVLGLLLVAVSALLSRWGWPRASWRWGAQWLMQGVLGSLVIAVGLFFWGVDGKMMTWTSLVVISATTQWLLCQGWRR